MRKRKQIITSMFMGGAVAALSVTNANAAQLAPAEQPDVSNNLVAQTTPLVPNPRITIDNAPTMPRAVAPSVGDISVSNLDAAIPQVNLDSSARINMILKNTSAREVLESLARSANLNLAYSNMGDVAADGKIKPDPMVTINLRNEPVQNAFNYVLQLSGLEAVRTGNTVFVGRKLPDSVQETVVRTLRMNQISADSAAGYLAAQGAEVRITSVTEKIEVGVPSKDATGVSAVGVGAQSLATGSVRTLKIDSTSVDYDKSTSPVVLKGLSVSADERLNSVTLTGSPRRVSMATAMLTRLDARRRQVALNVKIVDVNLSNANLMSNSLSFKVGDGFLSVDKGAAVYNYGGYNPATTSQVLNSPTTPPVVGLNLPGTAQPFLDYNPNASLNGQTSGDSAGLGNSARPNFGTTANPYQPGVTAYTPPTVTPGAINSGTAIAIDPLTGAAVAPGGQFSPTITPATVTYGIPTNYQIPTKFLSTLQAQIISGNGKILTDPTLVVQEGQKSTVNLTQDVFGGFKINTVAGTGATTSTREPIIKQAGLSLDILVNRIDDNGFVSVAVIPTVSSIGSTVTTTDGDIALLQSRTLNSGEIRLRDGQTLILSGIIQESDRTSVTKVPILGDIPILGALFRSTNKTNQRQEVVVLLTPQILNDNRGQVNYTPGVDARLMIGR